MIHGQLGAILGQLRGRGTGSPPPGPVMRAINPKKKKASQSRDAVARKNYCGIIILNILIIREVALVGVFMAAQIKSKERVADHGEVFTAEREVNAMLDLVKQETERIDSRFLEPACGDGNFLAEILRRKLEAAKRQATPRGRKRPDPFSYEKNAVLAISSIYGVELLMDNVLACRERLFKIWDKEYKAVCKKETKDQTREAVRFILSRNIICGNALTPMCVDENGVDTEEPIVFSEWAFVKDGIQMQRKDYTFDELVNGKQAKKQSQKEDQMMLFGDEEGEAPDPEGKFLAQYVTHYRRVQDYDTI